MYIPFTARELKLEQIYRSKSLDTFGKKVLDCPQVNEIYGEMKLPKFPSSRPYTFGSFVHSIDGRIAFPDSPDGTLVAKKNRNDPQGALCDYWILNMLRAIGDAVVMGAQTIKREPDLTGHVFDRLLVEQREKEGRPAVPLHVVVSGSGGSLPLDHRIITSGEIPCLILTSPEGRENILKKSGNSLLDLGVDPPSESLRLSSGSLSGSFLLATGRDKQIDIRNAMGLLKQAGIQSMLIESPRFMDSLIRLGMQDELFLNTSGIYISGDSLSLGDGTEGFTTRDCPQSQLLSMHSHSDYFTYARYRFIYDDKKDQSHDNAV